MKPGYDPSGEARRIAEILSRMPSPTDDPVFIAAADASVAHMGLERPALLRETDPVKRRMLLARMENRSKA